MAYGLCGAHRTGKTTLAAMVAERLGIPFVKVDTSSVFRRLGYQSTEGIPFGLRMELQNEILDFGMQCWSKAGGVFITDRSPIDMIAYTLCEMRGDFGSGDIAHQMLMDYMKRCYEAGDQYFSAYILIQPGIQITSDESKITAPLNKAYMENLTACMTGLLMSKNHSVRSYAVPRSVQHIEDRIDFVIQKIITRINATGSMLGSEMVH